jgi:Protein of unknown function (DUF1634)
VQQRLLSLDTTIVVVVSSRFTSCTKRPLADFIFSWRVIIQLGLSLLVATPVARVIFSVAAFAPQRDWAYVVITLIVLAALGYSLLSGAL